jgi:hypothetical protein
VGRVPGWTRAFASLIVILPCSNCLVYFGTRVPFGTGEAEPWPHALVSWPIVPSLCDFGWCCCDCLSAKLYLVCGASSVLVEWTCTALWLVLWNFLCWLIHVLTPLCRLLPGVVPSSGLVILAWLVLLCSYLILNAPALCLVVLTVSDLRQSPALLCWLCHVILLIWDRLLEMLCSSYMETP